MEAQRFDHFARLLGGTTARRRLLGGLALSPFASLLALRDAGDTEARKRKRKGKKGRKRDKPTPKPEPEPEPNAHGCLDVGQPCRGDGDLCCSGICEGEQPKQGERDTSRCVAHDESICMVTSQHCREGDGVPCSDSNPYCWCQQTTGNAAFCGDLRGFSPEKFCRECSRDSDCSDEFGPGAACVVFDGTCEPNCAATGGTACMMACRDALPGM